MLQRSLSYGSILQVFFQITSKLGSHVLNAASISTNFNDRQLLKQSLRLYSTGHLAIVKPISFGRKKSKPNKCSLHSTIH
ncbi:unnamed protein product [Schistosoma intercalatum]|nr:unnamed protein product [Schistosoma intercalatum]